MGDYGGADNKHKRKASAAGLSDGTGGEIALAQSPLPHNNAAASTSTDNLPVDPYGTFGGQPPEKKPKTEPNYGKGKLALASSSESETISGGITAVNSATHQRLHVNSVSKPTAAPSVVRDLQDDFDGSVTPDAVNCHQVVFPELTMVRRLFEWPTTREAFGGLKGRLEPILIQRLRDLARMDPTVGFGLEIADSICLLKLLGGFSNQNLESGGELAGRGAMLLSEGARLLTQAQKLVLSAFSDGPEK